MTDPRERTERGSPKRDVNGRVEHSTKVLRIPSRSLLVRRPPFRGHPQASFAVAFDDITEHDDALVRESEYRFTPLSLGVVEDRDVDAIRERLAGPGKMSRVLRRPTVLLSYFTLRDLGPLLDAVRRSGLNQRATVYAGSYGANPRAEALVREEACLYAPMLALRNVLPSRLPPTATGRVAAGREAGRSFRDAIRSLPDAAESWQFDELSYRVASSRPAREFARGVLAGLLHGRAQDPDISGFVWLAARAFSLPLRPVDAELDAFWHVVDAAASHIVGEEFPPFVGDPAAAAHAEDAGRRALSAGGPIRRSLALRYMAGITPGYRLAPGLGGNVDGRSRTFVNRWRGRYLAARHGADVRSFAVFNFRFGNASPQVMNDVLRAIARAL